MWAEDVAARQPGRWFADAAEIVLAYLREQVPLGLWSISRLENDRQTYLHLDDEVYGLARGGHHPWADSFCRFMAAGEAPQVAPRAQEVAPYRGAGVNQLLRIEAYVGAPIREADGTLFGTICGLDPVEQGEVLLAVEPLVDALAGLLETTLAAERESELAHAFLAQPLTSAEQDPLTGLLNRTGWQRVLRMAQDRLERLGDPTVVVRLDLEGLADVHHASGPAAADRHVVRAGRVLQESLGDGCALARFSGGAFAVLLVPCDAAGAAAQVDRLAQVLRAIGASALTGWAAADVPRGVRVAADEAERALGRAGVGGPDATR
jgi:diguanylate cyclase (GGDEF)-like protein